MATDVHDAWQLPTARVHDVDFNEPVVSPPRAVRSPLLPQLPSVLVAKVGGSGGQISLLGCIFFLHGSKSL